MNRGSFLTMGALVSFALLWSASQAPACTQTGFVRDSINLTAALINPSGNVAGDVDATGCNIGIYYGPAATGSVNGASIHSANYFGVVNNGADVSVINSTVYDIGEVPLNGDQHGVGIYFAYGSAARGDIAGNTLWNYQKGGIVVNGPDAQSDVRNNTVVGQGPVNYIAQNGIQLGYGSQANVHDNLVVGNSYTGTGQTASGGIILVGGDCYGGAVQSGSKVSRNTAVGNDVGVWFSNLDASCNPVTTLTRDTAADNTIRNNAVNNTTGDYPDTNCTPTNCGYQAGIADQGDGDQIFRNSICGVGYTPVASPPPYLYMIDVTDTNAPVVSDNTTCSAAGPVTDVASELGPGHGKFVPNMIK